MHGTFTCSDDAANDWSRIDWEIVIIGDPEPDLVAQYRVTSIDRETGTVIGSYVAPAGPDGGPPSITIGDIVATVGRYRIASIYVQIEAERLGHRTLRVAGVVRRWHLAQRRRALRRAFEEVDACVGRGSPS